jgi:hypothetical protein
LLTKSGLPGKKVTHTIVDFTDNNYFIEIGEGRLLSIFIRSKEAGPSYDYTHLLPEVEKIVQSVQKR